MESEGHDIHDGTTDFLWEEGQKQVDTAGPELRNSIAPVNQPGIRVVKTRDEFEKALADPTTLEIHLDSSLNTVFEITNVHKARSLEVPVRAMGPVHARVSGGRLIAHDTAQVDVSGGRVYAFDTSRITCTGSGHIDAYDNAQVDVSGGSVFAFDNENIIASGGWIEAHGASRVVASGGIVIAYDISHVNAGGETQLYRRSAKTTFTADEKVRVSKEFES